MKDVAVHVDRTLSDQDPAKAGDADMSLEGDLLRTKRPHLKRCRDFRPVAAFLIAQVSIRKKLALIALVSICRLQGATPEGGVVRFP